MEVGGFCPQAQEFQDMAIISETLDWFKDQFDTITKIGFVFSLGS
jgi:hypothetical protein